MLKDIGEYAVPIEIVEHLRSLLFYSSAVYCFSYQSSYHQIFAAFIFPKE